MASPQNYAVVFTQHSEIMDYSSTINSPSQLIGLYQCASLSNLSDKKEIEDKLPMYLSMSPGYSTYNNGVSNQSKTKNLPNIEHSKINAIKSDSGKFIIIIIIIIILTSEFFYT